MNVERINFYVYPLYFGYSIFKIIIFIIHCSFFLNRVYYQQKMCTFIMEMKIRLMEDSFTEKEFVSWVVIWLLIIMVTLFPFVLDPILKPLGFFRALDFLVISGFLLLILMVFYTYSLTKKTQKQVESIVRTLAIKKSRKK